MNPAIRTRGLPVPIPRLLRKAAPPESSLTAGFRPYYSPYATQSVSSRKLQSFQETFGGADDGVSWVFACLELLMQEASSWPWEIFTGQKGRLIPHRSVPKDLVALIEQPNKDMTYGDFIQWMVMDEYLTGNSYWVQDEMNALGQPLSLLRLRPEFTTIAIDDSGRVIGYLYNPPSFALPVPFDREEVIHYRRGPNPRSEYYGMGVVEGIQRTLEADLAQTDHIIGFFSDGARLSGVLTTGTLSEVQFERFKQQFSEEYAGAANAHKILIAEEGTRFEPISSVPAGSGVQELRLMTKDEVLSAFGVPAPMLGGTLTESTYKMEESQDIFSRRMYPLASRISERTSLDLVSKWKLTFKIDATYAEPRDHKIERASGMLSGGASVNESRREMNLPPYTEEWADVPVIPQGFAPFGFMTPGGAPSDTPVSEGGNVNGNQPATTVPAQNNELANSAGVAQIGRKSFVLPPGFDELRGITAEVADNPTAIQCMAAMTASVDRGEPLFEAAITRQTSAWATKIMKSFDTIEKEVAAHQRNRSDVTLDDLLDIPLARTDLQESVLSAVESVFKVSERLEPVLAENVRNRMADGAWEMVELVMSASRAAVNEGQRRSYSMRKLALGYDEEGFIGVAATFHNAVDTICDLSRSQTIKAHNLTALAMMKMQGIERVEVLDGRDNLDCLSARNAVWTVGEAMCAPIAHARCARTFVPID